MCIFRLLTAFLSLSLNRKFEQVSTQSPLTVVLSAIDDMCLQIANSMSLPHITEIYSILVNEFGTNNINSLLSLVPSAALLIPSNAPAALNNHVSMNTDYSRLCYTLKAFVRILIRSAGPCIIFLDDLQWADVMSLGVVYAVLSGVDDSESLLFVGSYRSNDIENGQYNFSEYISNLNARFTAVILRCLDEQSVNIMVSHALGLVPRLCTSLSSIVWRKTKGNPFFVEQFLQALVDKDLLVYSIRERRWIWDVDSE